MRKLTPCPECWYLENVAVGWAENAVIGEEVKVGLFLAGAVVVKLVFLKLVNGNGNSPGVCSQKPCYAHS